MPRMDVRTDPNYRKTAFLKIKKRVGKIICATISEHIAVK